METGGRVQNNMSSTQASIKRKCGDAKRAIKKGGPSSLVAGTTRVEDQFSMLCSLGASPGHGGGLGVASERRFDTYLSHLGGVRVGAVFPEAPPGNFSKLGPST